MQAVCERGLIDANFNTNFTISADSIDYGCIQEVIEGGCSILETLISLARADVLRFAPVRVFLRVTTASIFLLKAISLGVRNGQLLSAFGLLDSSISAIRASRLDEMHLALRYATLLETHIKRLRRGFQRSSRPTFSSVPMIPHHAQAPSEYESRLQNSIHAQGSYIDNRHGASAMQEPLVTDDDLDTFLRTMSADDWLSLPFDPSMAPFNTNVEEAFPTAIDDSTLDFIWNIAT